MDLDLLLRSAATVDPPSPEVLARGRLLLDDEAGRHRARADLARRAAGRSRAHRLRRPLVAALVAGAASLALVAGPALDLGGAPPRASAAAAEVLLRAGDAAGEQEGGWPDAAYWHSVSTYRRGGEDVRREDVRREIWLGHRSPGVLRDPGVRGDRMIPIEVASFAAGGTSLSWDDIYALPTDPAALEQRLRDGIRGAGPDDDTELFVIVGDLLRESPAPPPLRRALWQVAARVPGVELVGPATDAAGRTGTAIRRGDHTYLLDPDDGRLLEESSGDPDAPPRVERDSDGQVQSISDRGHRTTYLQQGPADQAPTS